ncbi:MAG: hypothetical protein ABI967_04130 [bacterium]
MLRKSLTILAVVLAFAVLACNKSETTNRAVDASTNRASTNAPAPPPTSSSAAIGVPECDEFIAAYESCISNKVPADSRAQLNTSVAAWRKSWRALANDARSKPSLVQICKSSMEQARTSMKVYGCTF